MSIQSITTKEELETLIAENKTVVVDFWAEWCGPCKMLAPVLEDVDNDVEDLTIVKVNIDQAADLSNEYGIRSIPTLMLYNDGTKVGTKLGAITKSQMVEFVNNGT